MKRLVVLVCAILPASVAVDLSAAETRDTLLPPPGWLRKHAIELNVDASIRQNIEQTYKDNEPKYHQLKYKVERLNDQLYAALVTGEFDKEQITKRIKALLEAENELKLHQVHVRISLLSQLSSEQRQAARELIKHKAPASNWRGPIETKVAKVRELSKRISESGGSIVETRKQMKEIDKTIAAGNVSKGVDMLDQVIRKLEESLVDGAIERRTDVPVR